jgi:hypothetical protein
MMNWIRLSDVIHDNIAALEVRDIDVDIIRDEERLRRSDATGVGIGRSKDVGASAEASGTCERDHKEETGDERKSLEGEREGEAVLSHVVDRCQ